MSRKFTAILAAALTLGALALTAEAQQHRATRLGNPATRFAQNPPRKPDDVRVLLRGEGPLYGISEEALKRMA